MPCPPWLGAAAVYLDRRIAAVLFLGFASGLPLALTGSTLSLWLAGGGVSRTAIGLFALATLPYALKFAWAPLIDRLDLPVITRRLGRRRGWAVVTQVALMAALVGLGATDPMRDLWWTAMLALIVAFCSASQDIVIDAFRVEILEERQFGAGAATVVLGYRFGMLASGAGALYLASILPWAQVYQIMAGLVLVGMVTVLLTPEPAARLSEARAREEHAAAVLARRPHLAGWRAGLLVWLYGAVVAPFAQFMTRRRWLAILLFITLYKLGDVLAGVMAAPLYVDLGFDKVEIANVTKVFGLIATIAGGLIGGALVGRLGILRSLMVCGVLQMATNLMFALLALSGHNLTMLALTVGVENLAGGMATAAFVAYLSSLCDIAYTATQYALLSSFASVGRDVLAASGGWFADQMGWVPYFVFTMAAALPGLLVLGWLIARTEADRDAAWPVSSAAPTGAGTLPATDTPGSR